MQTSWYCIVTQLEPTEHMKYWIILMIYISRVAIRLRRRCIITPVSLGKCKGKKSHDKATAIKSLCSTHPLVSPWGLCSKSLNSHCRAAGALRLHGQWACQSISFWPPNWAGNTASLWMLTPAEGRMFSPQTDSVENAEHGLQWECNERDTQFE